MNINWASLGIVGVVSLGVGVVVVVLVALALTGLSARVRQPAGGPQDGAAPRLSAGAGTAVAAVCLLAVAAIIGYGLYLIIA
jgi:hypothetical protein